METRGVNSISFRRTIILLLIAIALMTTGTLAEPTGLTPQVSSSERYTATPNAIGVQSGNVTDLGTITGTTVTSSWAGFFGNLTAEIVLANAAGNLMYDWNNTNPTGQIYSANGTVDWTYVQCFNFTATGTYDDYGSDIAAAGGYNLYGKNFSLLEQEFGISDSNIDGVNETFDDDTNTHTEFYANSQQFSTNECPTTYVYDNTGAGVAGNYEEVLLWDPTNNNTIFTTLLDQETSGFDNMYHDFEILVLEDGHGAAGNTNTNYNFYVELA